MWLRRYASYVYRVVISTSSTSKYRSMSWATVARVRGFRFSSTWASNLVRAFSASLAARGPAGIVSTR